MRLKCSVDAWPESLQVPTLWSMLLPLHLACSYHIASTDRIRYLVNCYPHALYVQDYFLEVPLHKACHFLHRKEHIIGLLMGRGPNAVKIRAKDGCLPLHLLCHGNASFQLRQTLTLMWPDAVRIQDKYGYLPLHYACDYTYASPNEEEVTKQVQVIEFLIELWTESLQ